MRYKGKKKKGGKG